MKQNVSPAIIVTAIVAVVAIACFFGFKALMPDNGASSLSQSAYKNKAEHSSNVQQQNMEKMKNHGPGGGPSGVSDYRRRMQQGH